MYKAQHDQHGLTIIEGLEPIRRRPAMYVGAEEPGRSLSHRLLEGLVDAIANDTPPPHEIRVQLWSGSAITVAWEGVPLPIDWQTPHGILVQPSSLSSVAGSRKTETSPHEGHLRVKREVLAALGHVRHDPDYRHERPIATHVAAWLLIRPLPRHSLHWAG